MIPITSMKGKRVAVFGLGGSGLVTAEALVAGGAEVIAWDDNEAARAAAEAREIQVTDWRGTEFGAYSALVLAPGVPLTHPEPHWSVKIAREAGVEIIGDICLFARERTFRAPTAPFVAITGTNGKSTTTALIHHILKSAGKDVEIGGNFGPAVLGLRIWRPTASTSSSARPSRSTSPRASTPPSASSSTSPRTTSTATVRSRAMRR
jgi:UDP-N-acetylmuramoylalanine--D-glutamate ligase (EC 6.3.2.9)